MKPTTVLLAAMTLAGAPFAGSSTRADEVQARPADEKTQGATMPTTVDEHLARATAYDEKAAAWRREAALHRDMLADYHRKEGNPALRTKLGRELPWVEEMRKHCEGFIKDAERLAADAERFAQFHRMRADEMRGK